MPWQIIAKSTLSTQPLTKAFDKVDHYVVINKLRQFAFSDGLLQFIFSCLSNRVQFVRVNNYESNNYFANSGVPQGSHLGPLIFLLFINDIVYSIKNCKIVLFADDLKMYKIIRNCDDPILMQLDINNIFKWSIDNRLPFNTQKCKIMTFSRNKQTIHFPYSMDNLVLEKVELKTDLGIKFDSKLSFNEHVLYVANLGYRNLGFIIRNSKSFKNMETLLTLYSNFVRSRLEYCSIVWCPFYTKYIQGFREYTKKIY